MPFVTVRLLAGSTHEQKRKVVDGITDTLVSVLGKNKDSVQVVLEEVDPENWGIAGDTVAGHRT